MCYFPVSSYQMTLLSCVEESAQGIHPPVRILVLEEAQCVEGGGGGLEGGKSGGLFRNWRSYRQGVGYRTEFLSCQDW